jgi:hypothetical protein
MNVGSQSADERTDSVRHSLLLPRKEENIFSVYHDYWVCSFLSHPSEIVGNYFLDNLYFTVIPIVPPAAVRIKKHT